MLRQGGERIFVPVFYDLGDPAVIKNGVVYPSRDPAIFELKYPDTDIIGRVVGDV